MHFKRICRYFSITGVRNQTDWSFTLRHQLSIFHTELQLEHALLSESSTLVESWSVSFPWNFCLFGQICGLLPLVPDNFFVWLISIACLSVHKGRWSHIAEQEQNHELQAGSFVRGIQTHPFRLDHCSFAGECSGGNYAERGQSVFSTCQEPIEMMCEKVNLTYGTSCCFYQQRIMDF